MILNVCIASFYLSFIVLTILKDLLIFISLKYSHEELDTLFKLLFFVDLIIILSLPLIMKGTQAVCS